MANAGAWSDGSSGEHAWGTVDRVVPVMIGGISADLNGEIGRVRAAEHAVNVGLSVCVQVNFRAAEKRRRRAPPVIFCQPSRTREGASCFSCI